MLNHDENNYQVMFMSIDDIDAQCPRGIDKSIVSANEWRKAPFNDLCLQQFFRSMDLFLRRYSEWEEVTYTAIYMVISVLAVIGNGVVILAVIRKREMRTNRNVLIVNLALSNLMLALTNIPFLWLPSIDFEFLYSRFFCKFANALPGSNIYCSTLTISVMAIDRYYTVKRMYASSHRRQCVRAVCISISIWIISFLLSFPLLVYYDTTMLYVFKDVTVFSSGNATKLSSYGWRQCRLAPTQRKGMEDPNEAAKRESDAQKVQLFMSVMQALFLYVVPLIVLLIFNAKLTRFLQENSRQMHRSLSDRRSDDAGTLCIVKSSDLGQTAAVRNLPARRMNVRKRNRTTALLIAMAASYAVLWLPFTVVSMLLDLRILYMEGNGAAVIERIDQSCKMISIMSICVNPFLYGFLNTNFRHEFTDIFNQWICYKLRTTTNVQQEYSTVASPRRQSSSHPPQVPASNRFLQLLQNPYVRRSSAPCSSFIKTSIARKGNVETSVMRSRPLAKRSSNYCCNGFSNDPLLEFRECDETTTEGVTSPRHMQPLSDDVSLL